jgi:hypothetical protein
MVSSPQMDCLSVYHLPRESAKPNSVLIWRLAGTCSSLAPDLLPGGEEGVREYHRGDAPAR